MLVMKPKTFVKYIKQQGATWQRYCVGSHVMFFGPNQGYATVPTGTKSLSKSFVNRLCKNLNIDPPRLGG